MLYKVSLRNKFSSIIKSPLKSSCAQESICCLQGPFFSILLDKKEERVINIMKLLLIVILMIVIWIIMKNMCSGILPHSCSRSATVTVFIHRFRVVGDMQILVHVKKWWVFCV